MHLDYRWDAQEYLTETIARYGELGLEVHITEFDVTI
jgi:GH35 family endo-1,4-beta-xylanase